MNRESLLNSSTIHYAPTDTSLLMDYEQTGNNTRNFKSVDASVSYKKTFLTPGMELTSDLFYTQRNGLAVDWQNQEHFEGRDDYFQTTNTKNQHRDASAQLDFVTPVGNGGRIETG